MVAAVTTAAAAKTVAAVAAADDAAVRISSSSRAMGERPESRAALSIRPSMLQASPKRNKRVNFAICGQCTRTSRSSSL